MQTLVTSHWAYATCTHMHGAHALPHWACASHMHVHGTCALNKNGTSMYLSHLACMQAISNLEKITALHFSEYAKHDSHCISQ